MFRTVLLKISTLPISAKKCSFPIIISNGTPNKTSFHIFIVTFLTHGGNDMDKDKT